MWGDWWWRKPCYHPIETNCSFYAGTLLYIKLIRYPMIPKLILITGQQPSIALAEVTQRETICQALYRWSLTTHPWLDSMLFPGVLLWQGSPLSFHKKPVQLPSHTIYRILIDTHTHPYRNKLQLQMFLIMFPFISPFNNLYFAFCLDLLTHPVGNCFPREQWCLSQIGDYLPHRGLVSPWWYDHG